MQILTTNHPTHKIDDLIVPRVVIDGEKVIDGQEEIFFTKEFMPSWFEYETTPPEVGQRVGYQTLHGDGSGYVSAVGVVAAVKDPIAVEWIEEMINSGSYPSMFDSTHVTVELQCSLVSAFEFGAQDFRPLPYGEMIGSNASAAFDHVPTKDDPVHVKAEWSGIPLTCIVPVATTAQDEAFKKVTEGINRLIMESPDDLDVSVLLPIARVVNATVNKSITGWRSFFCRYSVYYETLYLKTCVYNEFCRRIQGVFVGCDKCHTELSQYQEARGITKE